MNAFIYLINTIYDYLNDREHTDTYPVPHSGLQNVINLM